MKLIYKMTKIEVILYYNMEGKAVKIPKNPNRRRDDSMARQATKTLFMLALAVMVTVFSNQVMSGR
jgi:hypothetical protein